MKRIKDEQDFIDNEKKRIAEESYKNEVQNMWQETIRSMDTES
jgi:hypothetical protein